MSRMSILVYRLCLPHPRIILKPLDFEWNGSRSRLGWEEEEEVKDTKRDAPECGALDRTCGLLFSEFLSYGRDSGEMVVIWVSQITA